jgi:hypothetical protein
MYYSHPQLCCCPNSPISVCQVKVGQELARAQADQIIAAQRDNAEVQGKLQGLLEAFSQYLSDQSALSHDVTFQAVVRDIREVCRNFINPSTTSGSKLMKFHFPALECRF